MTTPYPPLTYSTLNFSSRTFSAREVCLGPIYDNGLGVPEDYVRAYAWVSIAVARGMVVDKKAKKNFAKHMTPAQIAEAQKFSRELWEKYVVPFQKQ